MNVHKLSMSGNENPNLSFVDNGGQFEFVDNPAEWRVWRLSFTGHRLGTVPSTWDPTTGRLRFTARTDYDPASATLFYEIVREKAAPQS